jgi:molybdate transport system substrate-binding protein
VTPRPAGRRHAVAVLGLAILLVGCLSSASNSPSASTVESAAPSIAASVQTVELTVLGAASLQDALDEIETEDEAALPGTDLVIATDSSAALRTQIEEGAPADVFLAADTSNPDTLVEAGLGMETIEYAGNSVALVVPLENRAGIETPAELATDGVQIIAAGPEVPITSYVADVVAHLADIPGYPSFFADAYAANVVSEEDNVRGVLTKVELGEGDAGFVYQTDAQSSDEVVQISVPAEANTHAVYGGCVIVNSDHLEVAEAFLIWLAGVDGQAILAEFGFVGP